MPLGIFFHTLFPPTIGAAYKARFCETTKRKKLLLFRPYGKMRTAHFIGNARKSAVLLRFIYNKERCGDNTIKQYFCYFKAIRGAAARRFCRALFATSSIAKIQLLNYTFVYSKSNQPAAARRGEAHRATYKLSKSSGLPRNGSSCSLVYFLSFAKCFSSLRKRDLSHLRKAAGISVTGRPLENNQPCDL